MERSRRYKCFVYFRLVKVSYELKRHKDISVLLILGEWQCPKDDTS